MEKHIYGEKNGLGFTLHGDYYLPDIVLDEETPTYGKYGMIRKSFLKEHRPAKYQYLLLTGKLTGHLNQVDKEAREQVEMLVEQMAERKGVTEKMKAEQPMEWVGRMNTIKNAAEEIMFVETIYV
ncbi:MAG: TnpV protein [Muricoprocola sp.]